MFHRMAAFTFLKSENTIALRVLKLARIMNFSPQVFTLTGRRIANVRWDSNSFGIAAYSAVRLDDLGLTYTH